MTAVYRFLPWVRRGVAAALQEVDTLGPGVPARARLPVTLRVGEEEMRPQVALHGPGDVIGLDRRQVVHTDPADHSTGTETTRFAAVELRAPSLPWLFTPAAADRRGRLRPWLCLVVVPADVASAPATQADAPLPSLTVSSAELPDLAESWAWAHAQVVAEDADTRVVEVLADQPEQARSRLLCPRRLDTHTRYRACLVPAFETGRRAGLGLEVTADDEASLEPAWTASATEPVTLPVYYHWEFETGEGGDFASLAAELRPRAAPDGIGVRDVDVGPLAPEPGEGRVLGFAGALRARHLGDGNPEPPGWVVDALRQALERDGDSGDGQDVPTVGPPLYGSWQAAVDALPDSEDPRWLAELNVDPRHRAAAALGALVVRDQQDLLMASAWEQAGEIEEANQALRQGQLAREADRGAHRRLAALPDAVLVGVTDQVHGRVRQGLRQTTIWSRLRSEGLPEAATSSTLRRLARPRGPLARRAGVGGRVLAADAFEGLASGSASPAPPRPAPRDLEVPERVLSSGAVREQLKGEGGPVDAATFTDGFEEALADSADRLEGVAEGETPVEEKPEVPEVPIGEVADGLLAGLDPDETVRARVLDRLSERAPPRSEVTDPLEPAMVAPTFPQPMFAPLRDLGLDALAPGIEALPVDSVTLLEADPAFVEAFMVGLNHEMSRELLWRGYPTDQHATSFPHFWGVEGSGGDRTWRIGEWEPDRGLGGNHPDAADGEGLVLVLRGELLRRYPDAGVYAARAVTGDAGLVPGRPERQPRFEGTIEPDITFVGFHLTAEQARSGDGDEGWFFVIEQPADEPGFGIDPDTSEPDELESWDQLTWAHLHDDQDGTEHAPIAGPLEGTGFDGVRWGLNAAHMARITLRRPVRVAIHADQLLAEEDR